MIYIANIAMKLCKKFLVLNVALKQSGSLQQHVNQIIYECEITE
jgi:hypothetical protein